MDNEQILNYLIIALHEYQKDLEAFGDLEIGSSRLGFCFFFRELFGENRINGRKTDEIVEFLFPFSLLEERFKTGFWFYPTDRESRIETLKRAIKYLEHGKQDK